MKWGHWVVGVAGPHLHVFTSEPKFSSEPSLSRPIGKSFEIHPNNREKAIADLEKIYPCPPYESLQ